MSALPTLASLEPFELPAVPTSEVAAPASRSGEAYALPKATEFSDDATLQNAYWVVRMMKRFPMLWEPIRAATDRNYAGRGRRGYEEGDWAHVFAVFTMSTDPYLTSFWHSHQESEMWEEAGFPTVPSFNAMEQNFRRIEACRPVIEAAAYKLMRWAEKCDSRVNQDWHIDGTSYHSAAQLEHCCPDPKECKERGGNPPKHIAKLPDEDVKEKRHAVQASDEDTTVADDEVTGIRDLKDHELPGFQPDPKYRYQWLNVRGGRHLFRSLDKDAATRAYTGGRARVKAWHGGINLASTDNFTGAQNGSIFFPADETEAHHVPTLYKKIEAGLGHGARSVIGDRGLHHKSVFEFHTRLGTGTIIPWREPTSGRRRRDMRCDDFDEHGMPRCRYCGGAGTTDNSEGGLVRRQSLGWYTAAGEPRLRYLCTLGTTQECRSKSQSIACSKEWRMLLPIPLTSELYYALKGSSKNKENTFYSWRRRYNVAANDKSSRPRVRRRAHMELRSAFGLLLEWFRVCLRHGWLIVPEHTKKNRISAKRRHGGVWLSRVLGSRRRRGTALPYGRYADGAGMHGFVSLSLPGHDPPDLDVDEVDRPPPDNPDDLTE